MFYSEADTPKFKAVQFNFIEVEQTGHLLAITLNRPEKRNAFTPTMVNEIAFTLAYAQHQQEVWCVLLKANGPVFCAGMDLNVFQNPELDTLNDTLPAPHSPVNLGDAFRLLTKPSIAKVEGTVLAGAFLLICGCTFVVSVEEAIFGLPEVKRGIFPMQVIASLLRITTPRKALEMCILAETYSAAQAKELGIVTHLSSKESINRDCDKLISSILENSPYAISKGMEVFNAIGEVPDMERFAYLAQQLEAIRHSADAKEGINAFKEKRKPEWKNS